MERETVDSATVTAPAITDNLVIKQLFRTKPIEQFLADADHPGAGPGIVLSFILSGLTCALAALCYAELSAMIPVAGSAYTFSYATLGELLAWLTGWNLILEYGVACVAVAIGWSGYFNNLLLLAGIQLPVWATLPPGGAEGGIANIPAAIIVLLVTIIL